MAKGIDEFSQSELRQALDGQPRCYLWPLDREQFYSNRHVHLIMATIQPVGTKLFFAETEQDGKFHIVYLTRVGLTPDGYILAAPGGVTTPKIQVSIDLYHSKSPSVQLTSSSWLYGEETYSGSCYSVTASLDSNIIESLPE